MKWTDFHLIGNINTSTGEIEFAVKDLLTERIPSSNGFIGKFYQIFSEEIIPFLSKILQKIEKKDRCLKLFYEASIT